MTATRLPSFADVEDRERGALIDFNLTSSSYSKMSNMWQAQLERYAQSAHQSESLEDSARRAQHPSPTEFSQHTTTRDRERCRTSPTSTWAEEQLHVTERDARTSPTTTWAEDQLRETERDARTSLTSTWAEEQLRETERGASTSPALTWAEKQLQMPINGGLI